jgi:hypothetical protein
MAKDSGVLRAIKPFIKRYAEISARHEDRSKQAFSVDMDRIIAVIAL